jgi:hypothetical protein
VGGLRSTVSFFGLALVCAVAAFHLWVTPSNPPGYHRDEAALSLNAYTLSSDLRDEDGALLPLFFRSFDDYKSPLYPYVLAGVFEVTGPDARVARGLSAVLVLAAVLLLCLLARRLTRSWLVAAIVLVAAGLTPWLFELGRMAIEATTEPLLVVLLLLWLERTTRLELYDVRHGVAAGALVGAIAYSYTGSRLLGPLLAGRSSCSAEAGWRFVIFAWTTFLALLVPWACTAPSPGNLTSLRRPRSPGTDSRVESLRRRELFRDVDPWHWATAGDPAPAIPQGLRAMFAASHLRLRERSSSSFDGGRTSGGATCSWRPFSCRFPRR